jgi:hypothetical protein
MRSLKSPVTHGMRRGIRRRRPLKRSRARARRVLSARGRAGEGNDSAQAPGHDAIRSGRMRHCSDRRVAGAIGAARRRARRAGVDDTGG